MAVISKDLGPVSAYAVAVAHGYTGTEAEWEQLIADSAINAQTAVENAASARSSAESAAQNATLAIDAKDDALNAKSAAETASSAATTSEAQAAIYAGLSADAKTAAETAQGKAEDAAEDAQAVADSIPEDYTSLSNEVDELKSAFQLSESANHSNPISSSAFVQGSRIAADPFEVRALATRCTTKYVFHLYAGDVLTIKNISTGYKAAIGSSSLYDSGWKTAEFAYTATVEMFAYVNVATADGSTNIVPSDFTCLIEYTDNTSRTSALENEVSTFTDKTNALVNRNNIFKNPQMLTHDGWSYLTTDFTVEPSENQEFGVFKVVTGDTQPYIFQVFQPSELSSGEYYFTFRGKVSDATYVRLYIIAYPTPANTGGTATQLAEINLTVDEATYSKTVTMPDVSTYDHIRVLIFCGGKNKTYYLSELYLAPTSAQNYASYVLNAIRTAQASGAGSSSWLYGKTLYADGDSIAYGAGADGVSYADLLATKYNMTIDKQAVSGGTMAYVSGKHCIASSVVTNYAGQDFVILDGGFNDLGNSVPIGAFPTSPEQPLTPSPDTTTFIGALQVAFQHIMNTNPTAKIWFLIPHRINKSYTKTSGTLGLTFADYVDAIRLVCNRYGVEILDVYDNVNFNTYLDVYKPYTLNSDTVHPTLEGYQKFYMPYIEKVTK